MWEKNWKAKSQDKYLKELGLRFLQFHQSIAMDMYFFYRYQKDWKAKLITVDIRSQNNNESE